LDFNSRLDITRLIHADSGAHQYNLTGVVHHNNTKSAGHYVVFCRTGGTWVKFNDASFDPSSFTEASRNEAYIIFYEKVAQAICESHSGANDVENHKSPTFMHPD
jgi:ubiquitin C-terminal hydrolase